MKVSVIFTNFKAISCTNLYYYYHTFSMTPGPIKRDRDKVRGYRRVRMVWYPQRVDSWATEGIEWSLDSERETETKTAGKGHRKFRL